MNLRSSSETVRLSAGLLFAIGAFLLAGSLAAQPPTVHWQQHLVRGPDPGPSVTVSPDGHTAVHKPVFFKQGGDFVLQLEPQELADLTWLATQLLSFDPDEAQRAKRDDSREQTRRGEILPETVGAALSSFDLQLDGRANQIRWRGVKADAERLDHREIKLLGDLEARLRSLLSDPRLIEVARP